MFGPEYSLFSSNKTLRRQVEDVLGKKYTGDKAAFRPDLLLSENLAGEHLLIEFKRPSHSLNDDDYVQATAYRRELSKHLSGSIKVLLVGGSRSPGFPSANGEPNVETRVFDQVFSTARRQLEWQLRVDAGVGEAG